MNRFLNLARRVARGRPPVGSTPADVVHRENKWRLLRYRSEAVVHETPVLLVPSLINRHYVLDLLPGKSFVEHLVGHVHRLHVECWYVWHQICVSRFGRALDVRDWGRCNLPGHSP